MALSIQKLQDQIHDKERELKSVGSKVRKAGIGAMLTKNPLVGAAAGTYLGHERAERDRLNREISDLKNYLAETERQNDKKLDAELAAIQSEINSLLF